MFDTTKKELKGSQGLNKGKGLPIAWDFHSLWVFLEIFFPRFPYEDTSGQLINSEKSHLMIHQNVFDTTKKKI